MHLIIVQYLVNSASGGQSPVLRMREFPYLLFCPLICQYICKKVYPTRYRPEAEGNFVPSMLVLSLMMVDGLLEALSEGVPCHVVV